VRSKRRSAAKAKRPKKPIYYIDESLGSRLPEELKRHGFKVVPHRKLFPAGVDDEVWCREVGRLGYVALTKDSAMRSRPTERNAIRAGRLREFALCSGSMVAEAMAAAFIRARTSMEDLIHSRNGPFIARVSAAGKVTSTLIYTDRGWLRVERSGRRAPARVPRITPTRSR
jgi:hypothetical protein